MSPTFIAPDRQDTWAPVRLVDMSAASAFQASAFQNDAFQIAAGEGRYATYDIFASGDVWHGRIVGEPVVTTRLMDTFWGVTEVTDVRLTLNNADLALSGLYTQDFRNVPIVITRYDNVSGTTVTEFRGVITDVTLDAGLVEVSCASLNLTVFEQLVPKGLVNTTTFPLARDLGAVIPVIFGTAKRVPLPYVRDDTVGNQYDYLIGRGSLTVDAAYREFTDGSLRTITASEYTVSTALYSGYTVIRFSTRQISHAGGFEKLYADVTGLQDERNFAAAIKTLLSSTTWGLSQTVNGASFTDAAVAMDSIGGLVCDGAMIAQRPAQDVLRDLLMVRGMRLGMDGDGEWTLGVDAGPQGSHFVGNHWHNTHWVGGHWTLATLFAMALQDGTESGERNLVNVGRRTRPTLQNQISDLILRYRPDYRTGEFQHTQTRTIATVGKIREFQNPFIRDHTTADKVTDYLAKREQLNETLAVETTQEGRQLTEGDLVTVTYSPLDLDGDTYEVREVERKLETVAALLGEWSADIYTYTVGTLPTEETTAAETDFTNTRPSAASSLSISSSGTEVGSDGTTNAYVILQFTTPTTNYFRSFVRSRLNGATAWGAPSALTTDSGAGVLVKLAPLVPGLAYDFTVTTENRHGLSSTGDPSLTNQLAPGDTTAPSAPSAIALRQEGGKVVQVEFTFTPPTDWDTLVVYRSTTNDSGTASEIGRVKSKRFTDQDPSYGFTYYYWGRLRDLSGNLSSFSLSTANDVVVGTINTADITVGAATNADIVNNDATTYSLTSTYQTVAQLVFTVGAADSKVIIHTWGTVPDDLGGAWTFKARLRRDSTVIKEFTAGTQGIYSFDEKDTPGAGTFTYTVQVANEITSAGQFTYSRLWVVESKR